MKIFNFLKPKQKMVEQESNVSSFTVETVNLGLTKHGIENRPDLIENREIYSYREGDYIHFFKGVGTRISFDPEKEGYGHPSYSYTRYRGHKYIGSVKLNVGWIHDQFNNRIKSPNGEWFGVSKIFWKYFFMLVYWLCFKHLYN